VHLRRSRWEAKEALDLAASSRPSGAGRRACYSCPLYPATAVCSIYMSSHSAHCACGPAALSFCVFFCRVFLFAKPGLSFVFLLLLCLLPSLFGFLSFPSLQVTGQPHTWLQRAPTPHDLRHPQPFLGHSFLSPPGFRVQMQKPLCTICPLASVAALAGLALALLALAAVLVMWPFAIGCGFRRRLPQSQQRRRPLVHCVTYKGASLSSSLGGSLA
jgi:hypothetical protein